MSSQSCEVKRIQVNSAQQALDLATQGRDQARADYLACLGPQEQGAAALSDAQPTIDRLRSESEELLRMNEVLLQMLGREAQSASAMDSLEVYSMEEIQRLQTEIDDLKSQVRMNRRKFLDASPSSGTAVAGLYFTQTPDNQMLIAFLSCFGAFLVFLTVAILGNMVPVDYFVKLESAERGKIVGLLWILSAVITWCGFYLFT